VIDRFEHRGQAPLSRAGFARRLAHQAVYVGAVLLLSLAIGVAGYHWIAGFLWIDALLNASMLLGGMGPVNETPLTGTAAKLFASAFALYAGMVFLVAAGLLLTPVFHRVLHRFHWESDQATRRK
jgi:hypothetical protein